MSRNNCGVLQFVKGDGVLSEFPLIPNETYTIGTQAKSNIRLKVQTSVSESSILKINAEGITEFLSNGISRCLINNKPFGGTRYLIPGDIIDLFGRKFKYVNTALTDERIEILQRENRKLFCSEKLKEKVNRPTMFLKKNVRRTSTLPRGFRTPGPRRISKQDDYGSHFIVEDIENQPITPSQNSEGHPCHQKRFKNLFSTPQPAKNSDDGHFSFVQNYQINVNFGGSPTSPNTSPSKDKYLLNKMDDQPSDIVSVQNSPFDKHIAKAADDVTLINDISDPFSETPEYGKEFIANDSSSFQHRSSTTSQKQSEESKAQNSESVLTDNGNKIQNTRQKSPKSVSKKLCQQVPSIDQTLKKSVNKENRRTIVGGRTPKTIAEFHNNTDIAKGKPCRRIRTRSLGSMTSDLRKLKNTNFPDDDLSKTPLSAETVTSDKMNFTPQFTGAPATLRKSILKKTPYVHLVKDSAISSSTPSLRRCSQRMIKAKGLSESSLVTKKRSEAIENAVHSNNESGDEMLSDIPNVRNSISTESVRKSLESNVDVMINDDFVTRRSSKKPSAVKPIEAGRNEEANVAIDEEGSNIEYSSGSSSSHYDSDREEKQAANLWGINSLELSVLDSPLKNRSEVQSKPPSNCASNLETYYPSDQENATADENESYVSSLETSDPDDKSESLISSQSIEASNLNNGGVKRPRSLTNFSPNIQRKKIKRRMSTNELTDAEGIKDLLDMAHATPRLSFNELTDYEGIKDLLDVSSQAENVSVSDSMSVKSLTASPEAIKTPKNILVDVKGAKQPQSSPANDLSDVRDVKLKPSKEQTHPKNDLTNIKGVKKLMATPKSQKPPKNDLSDIRGVKKLMATPKPQKSPKNDLSELKGVKKLMSTPKLQKSPKNDLSDVRGMKKLMATPKCQKPPKNDLTDVGGVKKLMSSPKLQKSPKNDLSDVRGMKKLMATPKLQKPPKNDLSDVGGLKKLMSTPKLQKSPKNDLSDVRGMKKLMATPKPQKPPKKDLSKVKGLKKLMSTPKLQKSPKNDLSDVRGLKKLMATPKSQNPPKNDLSDLRGVKKLFGTLKEQNPPKDDLTNVRGVKDLFKMLENNSNREVTYDGLKELFQDDDSENGYTNPFDKLIHRKSLRTYRGKNTSPGSKGTNTQAVELHPSISKWVEEQRKLVGSSTSEISPTPSQIHEFNTDEELKQRPVRRTRRKRLPSADDTREQEASHVNTRNGRGRKKKGDIYKDESIVSDAGVNTRQKSKRAKIEQQSENNEEHVPVKAKSTKIQNKKNIESSMEGTNSKPKRGKGSSKKREAKIEAVTPIEHIATSTPISTGRTRGAKQMKNYKEDVSSETDEVTQTQNKRPTRKAAQKTKSTRSRKQPNVDKFTTNTNSTEDDNNHNKELSENSDEEGGVTNERTSDLSAYEPVEKKKQQLNKTAASKAACSKIKPIEKESDVILVNDRGRKAKQTPAEQDSEDKVPSKRGRPRKSKTNEADHDDNISSAKEILKTPAKRKLYDPEAEPLPLLEGEDHVDEPQNIEQRPRKRSRRNIYLPAMLEEYEHNLSGSARKEDKKPAPKRTTAKRKATAETDSDLKLVPMRVTRSRAKT